MATCWAPLAKEEGLDNYLGAICVSFWSFTPSTYQTDVETYLSELQTSRSFPLL